jgi:hypothetical protein
VTRLYTNRLQFITTRATMSCTNHLHFIITGATRAYTDGFKRVRDARIDRFVVETNKLLIRLDKLISPDAPTEPSKRKGE